MADLNNNKNNDAREAIIEEQSSPEKRDASSEVNDHEKDKLGIDKIESLWQFFGSGGKLLQAVVALGSSLALFKTTELSLDKFFNSQNDVLERFEAYIITFTLFPFLFLLILICCALFGFKTKNYKSCDNNREKAIIIFPKGSLLAIAIILSLMLISALIALIFNGICYSFLMEILEVVMPIWLILVWFVTCIIFIINFSEIKTNTAIFLGLAHVLAAIPLVITGFGVYGEKFSNVPEDSKVEYSEVKCRIITVDTLKLIDEGLGELNIELERLAYLCRSEVFIKENKGTNYLSDADLKKRSEDIAYDSVFNDIFIQQLYDMRLLDTKGNKVIVGELDKINQSILNMRPTDIENLWSEYKELRNSNHVDKFDLQKVKEYFKQDYFLQKGIRSRALTLSEEVYKVSLMKDMLVSVDTITQRVRKNINSRRTDYYIDILNFFSKEFLYIACMLLSLIILIGIRLVQKHLDEDYIGQHPSVVLWIRATGLVITFTLVLFFMRNDDYTPEMIDLGQNRLRTNLPKTTAGVQTPQAPLKPIELKIEYNGPGELNVKKELNEMEARIKTTITKSESGR